MPFGSSAESVLAAWLGSGLAGRGFEVSGISYLSSDTELRTEGWLDAGSCSFFGCSAPVESWGRVAFGGLSSEGFLCGVVCSVVCLLSVVFVFGDVLDGDVLGGSAGGWSLSSAFCDASVVSPSCLVSGGLSDSAFFTPGLGAAAVTAPGREMVTRDGTGDPWGVSGGEVWGVSGGEVWGVSGGDVGGESGGGPGGGGGGQSGGRSDSSMKGTIRDPRSRRAVCLMTVGESWAGTTTLPGGSGISYWEVCWSLASEVFDLASLTSFASM